MPRPSDELVFAPLGGVGEIGMNLAIYGLGDEHRRQWIAVDLGVAFADDDAARRRSHPARHPLSGGGAPQPSRPRAHPRARGSFRRTHRPVAAARSCRSMRRRSPRRCCEAKRESEPGAPEIPVNIVPLGGRFTLGPFDIELVSMAHSIPESNGLIIRTPLGTVLHTGDWKIDPTPVIGPPTDEAKLRALGDEGCLALIGDSTNAVREGRSPSEADVAKCLAELIRTAPARVAVTTFASNVARLRAVAHAARLMRARGRRGRPRHGAASPRSRARPAISTASRTFARSRSTAICRRTRCWRSAPAARASRARRSRASPRTIIPTSRSRAATA